jgi:hypothetical protein
LFAEPVSLKLGVAAVPICVKVVQLAPAQRSSSSSSPEDLARGLEDRLLAHRRQVLQDLLHFLKCLGQGGLGDALAMFEYGLRFAAASVART